MILIIGDSNFRNVIEEQQRLLQAKFKVDVVFEQAGTNEALKTILEAKDLTSYSRIVIATILNEIAVKGKVAKTRDEVINNTTKDQIDIIAKYADELPGTIFTIMQPLMRQDPPWMTDKVKTIALFMKDHVERSGKSNIELGLPTEITDQDILPDKVHLNAEGKSKYLLTIMNLHDEPVTPTPIDWAVTPSRSDARNNLKRADRLSKVSLIHKQRRSKMQTQSRWPSSKG